MYCNLNVKTAVSRNVSSFLDCNVTWKLYNKCIKVQQVLFFSLLKKSNRLKSQFGSQL